jgi:hypothetical protein
MVLVEFGAHPPAATGPSLYLPQTLLLTGLVFCAGLTR